MSNYLIDFADDASDDAISEYLTANQCNILHVYSKLNKVYHVSCEGTPSASGIVTSIIDDDASTIKLLEIINVPVQPVVREDSITVEDEKNWWKIYSMNSIDLSLPTADIPVYGKNTNIYVVDSGIEINHPEFIGQDISLLFSFTGDFADNDGHGTGLSSLIVGNTCGITASAIKVVKIFDNNVGTKQSDLLHAFDAILKDMANSANKFSVINLSWAIPKNQYIEDKIRHIIAAGGTVVAAAGNSGTPIGDITPASMPEVLTIGSYGENFTPSDFSNYTGTSAIALTRNSVNSGAISSWAPGEKIWTATLNGGYGYIAGTSCAAAIHSASIAYNTSGWLKENGELPLYYYTINGTLDNNFFMEPGRSGLLDLSDPKYAGSNNIVCTYYNIPSDSNRIVPNVNGHMVTRVGERNSYILFNKHKVDSFEWIDTPPTWITTEIGILVVSPTTEPTSTNGIDTISVRYRVYPIGGADPIDCTVNINVLSSTFDQADLPKDDPLLDIILLAPNTCSQAQGCGPCGYPKLLCTTTTPAGKSCYCLYTA